MDPEGSPLPVRCGSSLSVVKITPATRSRRGVFPFITHKFSDPEIEALYHLHSSNRKRMELFRIFLYALLIYAITQILIHACWVVHRNSPYPPHQLPKTGKDDGDLKSIRLMSPHALLNPHDVRHEFDTLKMSSISDHPHQHHPNSLQNNPAQFRTFSKDRSSEPRKYKKFPVRLNPSFMSHQQHPAINDSNLPTVANQDYPSNQPFFHKPRIGPVQGNHPHPYRKRRESDPDPDPEYDHEDYQPFHPYPQTTRTDQYDMIYMVVTFVLLGAILLITLLSLALPGFSKGNPHLPITIWTTHILLAIGLRSEDAALPLRLGLGWVLLEIFLIWVTVPLRFKAALAYNITITILHTGFVLFRAQRGEGEPFMAMNGSPVEPCMSEQLVANLILLLTTNALGILFFYLSDKKQRRAFLDTRQSLEMKLVIEEQAKEQERLLLSVLPEHLALKMRQDLGAAVDGQFKKIYMSRHENVSILYADIVGFTAISSTYSASELVKILNELFARFDRLADKYHQIRIKILGDCYYCICGAPEERTDHAVLCVHMGLSMVKAIKYVRETTNSPVDMRVGIHTGAILAGVLGQRQWQFDVYSKDVELANKMESSGMPGKVHISEATLSFLKDEFEVEPAFGERREEMLRIAGMKTYFITRVLKPFHDTSESKKISENGEMQSQDDIIMKDPPSDLNSTFAEDSTSAIDDNPGGRKDSELESYRLRLKEELISRDGYKDLSKQSQWLTLRFTDKVKEAGFVMHKEPYAGLSSLACPIALVAVTFSTFLVISFNVLGLVAAILVLLVLLSISTISAYETSKIKTRLKKASGSLSFLCALDSKLWVRRILAVLTILLLTLVNAVFTIPCFGVEAKCENMTYHYQPTEPVVMPNTDSARSFENGRCKFPAYLIIFCAFSLFSVTMLTQPGSWLKSFIILLVVAAHGILINFQPLRNAFDCSEKFSFIGTDLIPENWQLTLYIISVYIVLFTLNRRLEKSTRVLFLWKTEVEEQREHATQLRHKNESLVYNILPQHVATHFLGSRKRKHEELYSQSYSEVGILFASMPNFSDFYTEETVNNQGLECLRFLNEVISDFDALLEHPRFAENIFKIKTIASTYMAASGLNPSKQAHPQDPIMTRWAHLALLVEFALELKITLTGINEQSFNHFVLKMGINHGPITAGVIGARKPHYDIWGNSVNVASRMESTGKAGCIQVTEETYRILRIFGYQFEQRGLVNVKGKGQLMTYYLTGKGPELTSQEITDLIEQYQINLKQCLSRTVSQDH